MITTTYLIDAWNAEEEKIECFPLMIRSLRDYSETIAEFAPSGLPYKMTAALLSEKGLSDKSIVSVNRIEGDYSPEELDKIKESTFLSRNCTMFSVYSNNQLLEQIEKRVLGIETE